MASSIPSHLLGSGNRQRGSGSLAHSNSHGSFGGSGSRNGGLGSRHASHSTLKEDAINDWLSTSDPATLDRMPATPTGPSDVDTFIIHDPVGSGLGFGLMEDASSPAVRWNAILESASGGDAGIAKGWGDGDFEYKASNLIANLHVDGLFDDNASSSNSSYDGGGGTGCYVTLNLPGWNNCPDYHFTLDSDADSPDGVWCAQGTVPTKSLRRSAKLNAMVSVGALQESYGSPGAGIGFASSPPSDPLTLMGAMQSASSSLAPPRSLRQCSSAPQLQRDDMDVGTEASQLLNAPCFSIDVGSAMSPSSRITTSADLLGGDLTLTHHTAAGSGAQQQNPSINITLAASGASQGSQPSVLFQRRAVQRDRHMPAPSPVAVDTAQAQSQASSNHASTDARGQSQSQSQTQTQSESRTQPLNVPLTELTAADLENKTEEQKLKLAQLYQLHVAQQAARLGVYQDFVAPSQQFAGQEASERAAKAVQAALLYGMEGNGPRRLSVESTGLPTPITPQHPLDPAPGGQVGFNGGVGGQPQFTMPSYRMGGGAVGGRMPGIPMSAIETGFPQSIYYPQHSHQHHLHPHQQQQQHQQHQHQQTFTPQYYQQQQPGAVFMGQQGLQDMSGYTSTYPPPRFDAAGPNVGSEYQHTVGSSSTGVFERNASRSETGDLASEIAANPMQLQVPYVMLSPDTDGQQQQQQQEAGGIEPVHLHQPIPQRPLLTQFQQGSVLFPLGMSTQQVQEQPDHHAMHTPTQAELRSAPAEIDSGHLSIQQQQQHTLLLQQQQAQQAQQQQQMQAEDRKRLLKSKQSMPAISSRKHQPTHLSGPLSPPRSPVKMKSSSQLRESLSPGGSNSSSNSGKSIRKIASNKRINASVARWSARGASATTSTTTTKALGKARSMTMDANTITSPGMSSASATLSSRRLRTMSHASLSTSHSSSSSSSKMSSSAALGSKSPTPTPSSFNFSSLSFVNYGMNDADELCSAVAPSGSYKVPLKGYGSSGSESRSDDEDDEDTETIEGGSSPVKKARSSSGSTTVSRAESMGNLKSKPSAAAFPAELRMDPRVREGERQRQRSGSLVSKR